MLQNTVFSTKSTKKISADPSPSGHPLPHPTLRSAYGASTPSMLKSWVRHCLFVCKLSLNENGESSVWWKNYDDMFNRYGTIPDGAGQTDGRTICTLLYAALCISSRGKTPKESSYYWRCLWRFLIFLVSCSQKGNLLCGSVAGTQSTDLWRCYRRTATDQNCTNLCTATSRLRRKNNVDTSVSVQLWYGYSARHFCTCFIQSWTCFGKYLLRELILFRFERGLMKNSCICQRYLRHFFAAAFWRPLYKVRF